MIQRRKLILAVVLLILGGLTYAWFKQGAAAIKSLPCEDILHGCSNADVRVQAIASPKVMRAFEMRIESADAESIHASFDMHDMQMGLNRYRFQQQPDGSWRAMVTLPVCVSGRSDWLMTIDIKREAQPLKQYQLEFIAQP
ncbi:hypothetical protein LG198_06790 [Methylobacillus arboreus]|uniref:hypothetical protein n=1 Tax=Methylobacillus arboreus TaxID=755170 RepID=UPI001E2FC8BC|nr:hypothetical protein [Methylobacillus arboreus]MCB5190428.1 hypothetical protein [Methylobacillus arboreus]